MDDATWDEWTDVLGQKYRPGDLVSIATISGRSPQLVIAEVVEIRKRDSKGELIQEGAVKLLTHLDGTPMWDPARPNWQMREHITKPSCKVKAIPMMDARGFYRSNQRWNPSTRTFDKTDAKAVSYSIWRNILKINKDSLP